MNAMQFRDAILAAGLTPPEVIEPDKFHRFPGYGKNNGNTAGYCRLFPDQMGGVYGDWSTGLSEVWQAKREQPCTQAEHEEFWRQVQESKAKTEAELRVKQEQARKDAENILSLTVPAADDHPYLKRKGIKAHGLRVHEGRLVIPVRDGTQDCSLQYISADGSKQFLHGGRTHGCYYGLGKPNGVIYIAEGYATAASIHEATGHAVAVAFTAGNLLPAARTLRRKFPQTRLVICADDDAGTDGNPGLTKATEAACDIGGLLVTPDFGANRPEGATDFNDLHQQAGLGAVRIQVEQALKVNGYGTAASVAQVAATARVARTDIPSGEWPQALPLVVKMTPEPYPLDALPEVIRAAVREVQHFTKAPVPLVASSALGALSLALQAHVDAKRAERLQGPSSLFLLSIADSGERKSTCDGFFTTAIRDYETQQATVAEPLIRTFKADLSAWQAKRAGMLETIKHGGRKGNNTQAKEAELYEHEAAEPKVPRVPKLILGDETPENLAWVLAKGWPSGGVISAEAGVVFGAHGMNKDSIMRNLALLNILWDGGALSIGRRTSESFTLHGARLTVALQVQEATLRSFFERSGGLARGTGFLARFLVAWPESTQGYRSFSDPPQHWPALAAFNRRLAEILDQPAPVDEDGRLTPVLLPLSPDAKAAWVAYHDVIETELRSGGELYDVRDVASKSADNAARLAALFHSFGRAAGAIGADSFEAASRIAAWHLNESRRFFGELALPEELASAGRLDGWLLDYCRRERSLIVPIAKLQQGGPPGLRKREAIEIALRELGELHRARLVQDGRRKEIHVNPALIEGGVQ
jgi:putative DNA primase/helicase